VRGQATLLDEQLDALAHCGVREAVLMVGFGAARVERAVAGRGNGLSIRTCFNPFYAQSDNLVTAWLARHEMDDAFVLLNGDTLFEPAVLERLLARGRAPVALAVSHKSLYDDDDMKVVLDGEDRLLAIGKRLPGRRPDGEAIGMTLFRGEGVAAFRDALDAAVRRPDGLRDWYTTVLGELAVKLPLHAVSIQGLWWSEVDDASDLDAARSALARVAEPRPVPPLAADPAFAR
jgi:choline kinase